VCGESREVCEGYDSLPQGKESNEGRKIKLDLCNCPVRNRVERNLALCSSSMDMWDSWMNLNFGEKSLVSLVLYLFKFFTIIVCQTLQMLHHFIHKS
jgi:hypothetical protein